MGAPNFAEASRPDGRSQGLRDTTHNFMVLQRQGILETSVPQCKSLGIHHQCLAKRYYRYRNCDNIYIHIEHMIRIHYRYVGLTWRELPWPKCERKQFCDANGLPGRGYVQTSVRLKYLP